MVDQTEEQDTRTSASKKIDYSKLCQAIDTARQSLRRYREEKREAVRHYVGAHWSDAGSDKRVPVNLLALYVRIMSRTLVSKNPRVMLQTFKKKGRNIVGAMETWANREIERMRLDGVLQRCTVDGLFSIGVCKIGIASPINSAMEGWNLKAGEPFADFVSLDDFVCDMHARDWSEVSFIGHRYRAPLDTLTDDARYEASQRKDLVSEVDSEYNHEGDERLSSMGRGDQAGDAEEFEEYVWCWEVYLPRHNLVCRILDKHVNGSLSPDAKPFSEEPYIGHPDGPYEILAFDIVPDNLMPKAPVQDLVDLAVAFNENFRKLMRQADRTKNVGLCQGAADEDGNRVVQANDGEMIRVDNPEKISAIDLGGVNANLLQFVMVIKDLFDFVGGNISILGGLSPQSKTATQDKMLNENSGMTTSSMGETTTKFAACVIEKLCWLWKHDPQRTMETHYSLPGLQEVSIDRKVTPVDRDALSWDDLDVKVDPYSMVHQTPAARAGAINGLVDRMLPLMPLLQQQGLFFDLNFYLTLMAKLMDQPDVELLFSVQEPPVPEPGGDAAAAPGAESLGMPSSTTRNYVRESTSGRPQQGSALSMAGSGQSPFQGNNGQGGANGSSRVNGFARKA